MLFKYISKFTKSIIEKLYNLSSTYLQSRGRKGYLFTFLLGFSSIFSSEPIGFIWILFFIFPLFVERIHNEKSTKQFLKINFFFYSGYFTAQLYWLSIPLTKEPGFGFLIPFAIFLPTILLAPLFVFFSLIYKKLIQILKIEKLFIKIILFSFFFSIAEFIRSNYLFNGFPWQLFGHFFAKPIVMQSAEFLNIYEFSFLWMITILSVSLFRFKKSKINAIGLVLILLINILNLIYGTYILYYKPEEKKIDDLFIWGFQPNFSATTYTYSYNTMLGEVLQNLSNRMTASNNTLLLGPEAVIPFSMESKSDLSKMLADFIPNQQSLLVIGGINNNKELKKIYNSIYFINSEGSIVGLYKKKHLVPFGEYIPMRKYIPKSIIEPITGETDFHSDENDQNDEALMYQNFPIMIPAICYDIIFTEDIIERIKKYKYKNKPHIILNLTNDIWTGNSISPFQHLSMAQFTAARTKTPVVRVSNHGISAIIDENGSILKSTKLNKKAELLHFFKK